MHIVATVDARLRMVRVQYIDGAPTFDEWARTMLGILRDPAYEPGFGFLVDRRAAPAPNAAFVQATVEFRRAHLEEMGSARWAVVVNDPANYGMARMGQALGDPEWSKIEQAVFTDVADAEAWLVHGDTRKTG
jgi:hypothetical protein